jgi:pimeloyl-ACP methyl ester carboxylesterase
MSDWTSGDVASNGIRMHYYRTGGDKPPLVLSHGAIDSGLCWTRVARALENEYDVIMPDARGHGLSDAPPTGYTSADHAADLLGLIDALGLRRPALGGHSMGARCVLRLIADHPDIARCAFLEDPPMRTAGAARRHPEVMIRIVQDAQASDVETTIQRGRQLSPTWSDEELQPWADSKMHVSRAFLDSMNGAHPLEDWRDQFAATRCPVLLVTADPELGAIVTPEAAEEAARLGSNVQVVRLPGAGHSIRREQFDAYMAAVRGFLSVHASAAPDAAS